MDEITKTLLTIGGVMLLGLATDALGRLTALPRVTLLMLFGLLIGREGLDWLPAHSHEWFPLVVDMALLMVGFLLGGKLVVSGSWRDGKAVVVISLAVVLGTLLVMGVGLALFSHGWLVAAILAAVATATDPAATMDVLDELKARGPFSKLLTNVVAIDDAWGLVVFSLTVAVAAGVTGTSSAADIILHGLWELAGSIGLGVMLGVPMAYLTGRIRRGQPTLAEALGLVFLCGGLALWLDVSFLLAAMVMGAVVANLARHHQHAFHEIRHIEWPFMILFFVLAGANLDLSALWAVGGLTAAYIALRMAGRLLGGVLGSALLGRQDVAGHWVGMALMPQAGVALGMALVAAQQFPQVGDSILPVVVGGTVFFELFGPLLTRLAVRRSGEGEPR